MILDKIFLGGPPNFQQIKFIKNICLGKIIIMGFNQIFWAGANSIGRCQNIR